ncbi:hypothetical protein [Aeromonas salmonicida]|uniref:hypothetical protein n=1 Tax=Aeromonas salmonicida TaxID=645 RepID=UPI001F4D5084|nr:hypothetical protein [Aeromonas salmonicida]
MVLVKPVIHGLGINPESERATVDQRPVVLRPIGDGVKRFTHDADLRGMVVLRSLGFQLVPFKLHRFRKQRRDGEDEQGDTEKRRDDQKHPT